MAPTPSTSRLKKVGSSWHLLVDDEPYLILGAELHNSSMSSALYMDTVWEKMVAMGVNTVLGPITWEDIEPQEGVFDFATFDLVLEGARRHNLRLVILWFGSYKNGTSCYIPSWVKTDARRFPRMMTQDRTSGKPRMSNSISIFSEECVAADSRAFVALMTHLKDVDSQRTVIMVQVQNEVGLLGDSRDRSHTADVFYKSAMPRSCLDFLTRGQPLRVEFQRSIRDLRSDLEKDDLPSWEAVLGTGFHADEIFMAYYYALYVEKVTSAGKKVLNIPFFINVWQPQPTTEAVVAAGGSLPGAYPSGGAVSSVLSLWQKFAPSVDFIAPDIYTADYAATLEAYLLGGQPLFIPEQRRDEYGARRVWLAIGKYGALGACPFGIDSVTLKECAYTRHYKLLRSVSKHILAARQRQAAICGFCFDEVDTPSAQGQNPVVIKFGQYEVTISRAFVLGEPGPAAGMVIQLAPERFLLLGWGFKVQWRSLSAVAAYTGILSFLEKSVVDGSDGTLQTERVFNGDETYSGMWANMPNNVPDYDKSVVPITIPARTMIGEVTVYTLGMDGSRVGV